MNCAAENGSVCVYVCAVTHQASWEAAAKLMDAKERQREEGGRRGEREHWLSQVGDKCLYCSSAGARGEGCQ